MTTRTPQEIAEEIANWISGDAHVRVAIRCRIAAAIEAERAAVDTLQTELATMIGAHAEANYRVQTAEHERDEARAEIAKLRDALLLAREWCMNRGFSPMAQIALQRWIDDGMTGPLPELPEYVRRDQSALSDNETDHG